MAMFMPGRNGFAMVIGSLIGLKCVASPDVWLAATRDVCWVIGETLKARQVVGCIPYLFSVWLLLISF